MIVPKTAADMLITFVADVVLSLFFGQTPARVHTMTGRAFLSCWLLVLLPVVLWAAYCIAPNFRAGTLVLFAVTVALGSSTSQNQSVRDYRTDGLTARSGAKQTFGCPRVGHFLISTVQTV